MNGRDGVIPDESPAVRPPAGGDAGEAGQVDGEPSLTADLLRDWLGGRRSDAEFLGYDGTVFLGTPPSRDEVLARALLCAGLLQNIARSLTDADRAAGAASVLAAPRWRAILGMLDTDSGYEAFVDRERAHEAEARLSRLRQRVTEDVADGVLQEDERAADMRFAEGLAIPPWEAERVIIEVVEAAGAAVENGTGAITGSGCLHAQPFVETRFPGGPIEALRTMPASLCAMPAAFFDDWETVRDLFGSGAFSTLLRKAGAHHQAVRAATDAEDQYQRLSFDLQDTAILGFLWRTGFRAVSVFDSDGSPVLVTSPAEMVEVCDGRPDRLVDALVSGRLGAWLRYAVGDARMAEAAVEGRLKASTPESAGQEALKLLWKAGERGIVLDGVEYRSLAELGAMSDPGPGFLSDLRGALDSGMFEAWARDAQGAPEAMLGRIASHVRFQGETRVWVALWAIGFRSLRVGGATLLDEAGLFGLDPSAWPVLAEATRDERLPGWLEMARDWDAARAHRLKGFLSLSPERAVQQLLWESRFLPLRLAKDASGWFDVREPADLVRAWTEGLSGEVRSAFGDGRVEEWAGRNGLTEVVAALSDKDDSPPARRLLSSLWLCGWKALPLNPGDTAGPESVDALFRMVLHEGSEPRRAAQLLEAHRTGVLAAWLRIAQGRQDLADEVGWVSPASHDVLKGLFRAMGREEPETFVKAVEAELDIGSGLIEKKPRTTPGMVVAFICVQLVIGAAMVLWATGRIGVIPALALAAVGVGVSILWFRLGRK